MNSETITVQKIFKDRRQYKVPFYQRAYVWSKEEQWDQLWDDIEGKAEERSEGLQPTPHFMGAIVLAPEQRSGLIGVETHLIIDGQQRLTTFSLILKSIELALHELGDIPGREQIAAILSNMLWNPNPETMRTPDTERFKLWPTFKNRQAYTEVSKAASRDGLKTTFPAHFTLHGTFRKNVVMHPLPLEAAWDFTDRVVSYCQSNADETPGDRLMRLCEAVLQDFKFVVITLEENDDPQVIFETLNGRGARLHATDLIRNHLFMLADREGSDSEGLYENHWKPLEGEEWSADESRGRLKRPRLEWFMHAFLQARLAKEIDLGRVFASYKAEYSGKICTAAKDQARELAEASSIYADLIQGNQLTPIGRFGLRMRAFDASTTHALALYIALALKNRTPKETEDQLDLVVSYVVRRAVCGLTAKSYNKTFIGILKRLSLQDPGQVSLSPILQQLEGHAVRWPDDAEFLNALQQAELFEGRLDASRTRTLLAEIERVLRQSTRVDDHFNEHFGHLDVEHIMPRSWVAHWPLPDAPIGFEPNIALYQQMEASGQELGGVEAAAVKRHRAIRTLGNLTLLNLSVNREAQNKGFPIKRDLLLNNTNLRLNIPLLQRQDWDETGISERSRVLATAALKAWPGPAA